MTMQAYPILDSPRGRSAFWFAEPEGAPHTDGKTYHAALDWFGRGDVHAPVAGSVVEARASRGNSGQVFGGTVKIREKGTSIVYVMRHVDPSVGVGDVVYAGQVVAQVTAWTDGPPNVHVEIWRTLAGGYRVSNMIDPGTVTWTTKAAAPPAPPWPPPFGGSLRLQLPGHPLFAGWGECIGPMRNIARNGLKVQGCAISWRGHTWRGPRDVANVVRRLLADHT